MWQCNNNSPYIPVSNLLTYSGMPLNCCKQHQVLAWLSTQMVNLNKP